MAVEVSTIPPPTPARAGSPEPAERRVHAWIGQGVTVEGKISAAQDLRIDGRVDGTIEVGNHELVLGAGAEVTANLTAKSILIGGTVVGNVTASERVQIQATGSVEGDVTSPRLAMIEGAILKGNANVSGTRGKITGG